MKALLSILFKKEVISGNDVNEARRLYADMQTIHVDEDLEAEAKIKKQLKKHETMLNYYLEDEFDTVELLNDWILNKGTKSGKEKRNDRSRNPWEMSDED